MTEQTADEKTRINVSGIIFAYVCCISLLLAVESTFVGMESFKTPTMLLFTFLFIYVGFGIVLSTNSVCTNVLGVIFETSIFPFSLVFCAGVLMIELFPGWLRGYSNTIGSFIIKLFGFDTKVHETGILKSSGSADNDSNINMLIRKVSDDPVTLFNEVSIDDAVFENGNYKWDSFDNLLSVRELFSDKKPDIEDVKKIYKLLKLKNNVSYGIWLSFLASCTILLMYGEILQHDSCRVTSEQSISFEKYITESTSR